ncbi:hypothetical protein FA95DRAFT_1603226 [Auriscalpium vulgare]|uniref:Uncharacterized protein n=1 Tax=Auriscalpium vulgare TaxID=40419 RepID=A0ACB8S3M3_9AGAM|nr:hypothetical protein FA95DRAFT_1603226 [Auriscalpium vulgare]
MEQSKHLQGISQELIGAGKQANAFEPPILSIPVELLTNIFLHYAHDSDNNIFRPPSWAHIMLVCRHWKRVAKNYAKLWSYVDFHMGLPLNYRMQEEQLRRSKKHPLVCRFGSCRRYDILREHGHRIRCLEIDIDTASGALNGVECPILELLDLQVKVADGGPESYSRPAEFIRAASKNLRKISLWGLTVDITPWSHLSKLTALQISHKYELPTPTFDDVITLLRRCPELVTLTLDRCLPRVVEPVSACAPQAVKLLFLEELFLGSYAGRLQHLLRLLTFPSTTTLALDVRGAANKKFPDLLKAVGLHLRHPDAPKLRSATFQTDEDGRIVISASTGKSNTRDHFTMRFKPQMENGLHTLIAPIMDAVPIAEAAHLHSLFCSSELPSATWCAIFQRVPQGAVVSCSLIDMLPVMRGLVEATKEAIASGREIAMPARVQLRVPLRRGEEAEYEDMPGSIGELCRLLEAYKALDAPGKAAGVALETLELTDTSDDVNPTLAYAEQLCAHVGQLIINDKTWPWVSIGGDKSSEIICGTQLGIDAETSSGGLGAEGHGDAL